MKQTSILAKKNLLDPRGRPILDLWVGPVSLNLVPYFINTSTETILNQDKHVQAAVMFGRGRFNAGVVIDPKPEFKFDPADVDALTDFLQKIW